MGTKILIAEDGAVSRRLLRMLLDNWGYTVTEVVDGAAALKELQKPDAGKLAILDWEMPGLNGTEVVRQLRNTRPASYIYVLLLTARTDKSDVLAGLDSGADDYLTKPFDERELRARLRVGERIIYLQERLECALAASEFRASHDALTGLYNRAMIVSLLEREAGRCSREQGAMGAILADVDHFKSVNDTYGHGAGDQVLLEIAGRMQSRVRAYDFLGRYGGEEFLIVAPGCGPKETQEVAERLRQAVAKDPIRVGDNDLTMTISFGATVACPADDLSTLLKRADLALYEAKQAGRNRVAFKPAPKIETTATAEGALPALSVGNDQ
jgi:two-component system cell cycle response regulator